MDHVDLTISYRIWSRYSFSSHNSSASIRMKPHPVIAGTLGVLRSFIATASTREDRVRAVSLGTAGLTTGLSLGPAIQVFRGVQG